jgi:undecaprenyl-diphosphatase
MFILALSLLLFTFGLIAEIAGSEPLPFDRDVMSSLRNPANPSVPVGPAWLREVARDITSLGSTTVLGLITSAVVGYQLLLGKRALAGVVLFAVLGGIALNNLLKFVFARPRPQLVVHMSRMYTTSFPSGHATLSAITYLTMGGLLAQSHPSFPFDFCLMSFVACLTILIGLSRIYLGVHYPTDILGGWCIGAAWAMASWVLVAWLQTGAVTR